MTLEIDFDKVLISNESSSCSLSWEMRAMSGGDGAIMVGVT